MQNLMKSWNDYNQKLWASTCKWVNINNELMVNLTHQQLDMLGVCVENGSKQVQTLVQARRLPEAWTTQSELLTEFNKQVFHHARVTFEILMEAKKQWNDLSEESFTSKGALAKASN